MWSVCSKMRESGASVRRTLRFFAACRMGLFPGWWRWRRSAGLPRDGARTRAGAALAVASFVCVDQIDTAPRRIEMVSLQWSYLFFLIFLIYIFCRVYTCHASFSGCSR